MEAPDFEQIRSRLQSTGLVFRGSSDGFVCNVARSPAVITHALEERLELAYRRLVALANEVLNEDLRTPNSILRHGLPRDLVVVHDALRLVRLDFAIAESGQPVCIEIETAPAGWGFTTSIYHAFEVPDGFEGLVHPQDDLPLGGMFVDGLWWDNAQEFCSFAEVYGGLPVVVTVNNRSKLPGAMARGLLPVEWSELASSPGPLSDPDRLWYRQCYEYNVRPHSAALGRVRFVNPLDTRIEYKNLLAAMFAREPNLPDLAETYILRSGERARGKDIDIPRMLLSPLTSGKNDWVLKLSGGSEESWGSRCVLPRHQFSGHRWNQIIARALSSLEIASNASATVESALPNILRNMALGLPYVVQRVVPQRILTVNAWDAGLNREFAIDPARRGKKIAVTGRLRFSVFVRRLHHGAVAASRPMVHLREKSFWVHGSTDSILIPCIFEREATAWGSTEMTKIGAPSDLVRGRGRG
jgi:hypothetical protein